MLTNNEDKNKSLVEILNKAKKPISELHELYFGLEKDKQAIMHQKIIEPLASGIKQNERILCKEVVELVDKILDNYERQTNINKFANDLVELYNLLATRGNGVLIKHYPEKNRLSFCYYLMINYLNFSDPDMYDVCAENAYYCIVDHNKTAWFYDKDADINTFFLVLHSGSKYLSGYIHRCITENKSLIFNSNDRMLGSYYMIANFKEAVAFMIKITEIDIVINGEAREELKLLMKNVNTIDVGKVMLKSYYIADCIEEVLDDF